MGGADIVLEMAGDGELKQVRRRNLPHASAAGSARQRRPWLRWWPREGRITKNEKKVIDESELTGASGHGAGKHKRRLAGTVATGGG